MATHLFSSTLIIFLSCWSHQTMCGLLSCCQLLVFPYLSPFPDVPLTAAHCTESFFKAQPPIKPFLVLLVKITQGFFTEQLVGFTRALVSASSTKDCGLTPPYACELLPLNDQFLLKHRPSLFVLCTSHSAHTARLWDHSPTEVINYLGRFIFSYFDKLEGTNNFTKICLGSSRCRTLLRQEEEGLGRKSGFIFVDDANRNLGKGSSLGCNGPQEVQGAEARGSYLLRQDNMIGKQNLIFLPWIKRKAREK